MTPADLKKIIVELYGVDNGGQRKLAGDVLVSEVTVCRWVTGVSVIEKPEERLILLLLLLHREKVAWRKKLKEILPKASLRDFI